MVNETQSLFTFNDIIKYILANKREMNVIHNENLLQWDISFKTAISISYKYTYLSTGELWLLIHVLFYCYSYFIVNFFPKLNLLGHIALVISINL